MSLPGAIIHSFSNKEAFCNPIARDRDMNRKRSQKMPVLIEHIDAIARKRQRDVLYLSFVLERDSHRYLQ
jgi:hypothetical protein